MLVIEAVRIIINTTSGVFGRTLEFRKGLNIIRADNSSGKSSLFGALIYGLGFEELLGGRNERAMQSVYKSLVKETKKQLEEGGGHSVTQSEILLQVSNGEKSITTRRTIVHGSIKPQAIEVFNGGIITGNGPDVERTSMYLHDKGSATNSEIGFHKFLEEFLGISLPEILNQEGKRVKLYLPLVAAAHFIEQKSGWSELFANIPYYGVRDAQSKVFEFILGLDVFEIAAARQEISNQMRELELVWKNFIERINVLVDKGGGQAVGLPLAPQILDESTRPYIRFYRGDKVYMFNELFQLLREELDSIRQQLTNPIDDKLVRLQVSLNVLREQTESYEVLYESRSSELSQDRERLKQYLFQRENVLDDLRKNRDALKIQQIGLQANLKTSANVCPTCSQILNESLLDQHIHFSPMRIDENIEYLLAQQKMVEAFVVNLQENISAKEIQLSNLENTIQSNRQRMRSIRRDLASDERLPSEAFIERKVVLERQIEFLSNLRNDFDENIGQLHHLSREYSRLKGVEVSLPKEYHTNRDREKILAFESTFKTYLSDFEFTSKSFQGLKISSEKYTPVFEFTGDSGATRQVDIRFESSASDFIRAQWAYYVALMKTSVDFGENHFGLVVFDEPQQQSASTQHFGKFLKRLESFRSQQVIVLASFQNSEEDYVKATSNLIDFKPIRLALENEMLIEKQLV